MWMDDVRTAKGIVGEGRNRAVKTVSTADWTSFNIFFLFFQTEKKVDKFLTCWLEKMRKAMSEGRWIKNELRASANGPYFKSKRSVGCVFLAVISFGRCRGCEAQIYFYASTRFVGSKQVRQSLKTQPKVLCLCVSQLRWRINGPAKKVPRSTYWNDNGTAADRYTRTSFRACFPT